MLQPHHSDSEVALEMVNGVVQHGSVPHYLNCLILSTDGAGDGDIVAQNGYPLHRVKCGLSPPVFVSTDIQNNFNFSTNYASTYG